MSGQLAVIDAELAGGSDHIIEQFRSWERWLRGQDDPGQLREVMTQAKLLKEAARIRKMAAAVGHAAFRLEAYALRRLYVLGARQASQFGSGAAKAAAEEFARLDDDEFDALLNSWTGTACGTLAKHLRDKREVESHVDWTLAGRRTPDRDWESRYSSATRLEFAARTVLEQIAPTGEAFSVTEAAELLLDKLGVDSDDLTRLAAREVVRRSLSEATDDTSIADDRFPAFITFQENELWYRVPVRCATLMQLRWMADYRRAQARSIELVADELDDLACEVEEAARKHAYDADEFMLRWMWDGLPDDQSEVAS